MPETVPQSEQDNVSAARAPARSHFSPPAMLLRVNSGFHAMKVRERAIDAFRGTGNRGPPDRVPAHVSTFWPPQGKTDPCPIFFALPCFALRSASWRFPRG